MGIGIWVLGDQLSKDNAALLPFHEQDKRPPVILIEALDHVHKRPYHRQKLILIWSAMRHFHQMLRGDDWPCTYYKTAPNFTEPLLEWIKSKGVTELRIMEPSDRVFAQAIQDLQLPCEVILIPNNQFLWTKEEFLNWAKTRKRLILEHFYRASRRRLGILMDGDKPTGGSWNYDKFNRQPPKLGLSPPPDIEFLPDSITRKVIQTVEEIDGPRFGRAQPFCWGVTHQQAEAALSNFIENRLPVFGPFEDAMLAHHSSLYHSMLSPYLNIGLLNPLPVVKMAEAAYQERNLELPSVEGFIRQIIGWREFMHGFHHYVTPEYSQLNFFNHTRILPDFFWNGMTKMQCVSKVIEQIIQTGYAHHIQRLMVLANFMLISGIQPQTCKEWFHSVFIDAYDWVMQTNVLGMGVFADGGQLATKPYAASARYINRMSDYCALCEYSPKLRIGAGACPFNFFYWDFLIRHKVKLQSFRQMNLMFRHLDRIPLKERQAIQLEAKQWWSLQT